MVSDRFLRAALVALCLPSAALLHARAGLSGRVVDRAGDPVPRAVVELVCDGSSPVHATADARGRFALPLAGEGPCRLDARPPDGGEPVTSTALAAGRDAVLEVALDLELFSSRIEVRGAPVGDAVGWRAIREGLARDAGEALAALPGLEMIRKGGLAHDVAVRALQGESVGVAIDGQPLHGACPNRMDPPVFHVDFAEVERIEVRKGPFDVASGSLGGAVDILTRRPAPGTSVEAALSMAGDGYRTPSLTVAHGGERWDVSGGLAARRGDPYEDGDGRLVTALLPESAPAAYRPERRGDRAFDVATGWLSLGWRPRPGQRVELAATRQQADAQLYPYLQMDAVFDDATRVRAGWTLDAGPPWLASAEVGLGWSRVDHLMDNARRVASTGSPLGWSMKTDADARDASLRSSVATTSGWTVGLDLRRREWDASTWMAARGAQPQSTLPGTWQEHAALHAERRIEVGPALAVELGGRLETVASEADPALADRALYEAFHLTRSTAEDDLLVSGSAGLAWAASERWELSARLGSAERAPDPQERWFALRRMGADWVGNPALDPMRNSSIDLGAAFTGARASLDLHVWASRLDGAITLVEGTRQRMVAGVMNPAARTYVNHDARLHGAEATAHWALADAWLLSAGAAVTRGSRDPAPEHGVVDRDLAEVPPLSTRLALRWQPGRSWLEVEGIAAARQDRVDAGLEETPTDAWEVANLRGGLEAGRLAVVAGVENLFDRVWTRHLAYQRDPFRAGVRVPEPGRTVTVSMRWRR